MLEGRGFSPRASSASRKAVRCGLRPSRAPYAHREHTVGHRVDQQEQPGEYPLNLPGERWRIEHANQIVCEKPAVVARLTAQMTQVVFPGCERTDAVGHLYPASPGERRNMHQRDGRPPPGEEPAEDHERREGEMHDDEAIGEQ